MRSYIILILAVVGVAMLAPGARAAAATFLREVHIGEFCNTTLTGVDNCYSTMAELESDAARIMVDSASIDNCGIIHIDRHLGDITASYAGTPTAVTYTSPTTGLPVATTFNAVWGAELTNLQGNLQTCPYRISVAGYFWDILTVDGMSGEVVRLVIQTRKHGGEFSRGVKHASQLLHGTVAQRMSIILAEGHADL